MTLTAELYGRYVELIYKKTGMWFENHKLYYVEKRLSERMEELNMTCYRDYYQFLKFSNDPAEMELLINRITVNETYFFRDFPQLAGFAEAVLPLMVREKLASGEKKLKIWSAGCSTGEEPYTLAIILLEMLPEPNEWKIEIQATDINTRVLAAARRGYYNSRSVKDVPPEYLERYFTRRLDMYLLNLNVRSMVNFKYLNLMDQKEMKDQVGFDFIFCRNVLIYFSNESRLKVLESYYRSLRSGGYVYLGHSESVGRITEAFKMRRIDGNIVYYKP
ncbi:chemotaxis protein [Heliobacillus mobilis]|uniref:protein-glutamate O-methyltransferase n=2 Tax=Heliobacterium TaxID=2697 RepID=Q0PIE8_HELMO|nr:MULTISPECIES: protein-glutamate O-methyltransferase CheR [Heliobacterium]ABH04869.1 chemotaxis protein methyltransferase cheR [Heliobacterium mobile]MBC9785302.1 protein-glutamate O-methyltransferase CheR [Heliobacterium chlorum]MTV49432.1 chemotaxis protein [Heliobacterium mobile]